jgi:hypothetical protein
VAAKGPCNAFARRYDDAIEVKPVVEKTEPARVYGIRNRHANLLRKWLGCGGCEMGTITDIRLYISDSLV